MPDQLQLRGGTTTEHNSFTGALREVTVDTTKKTLVVHDGSQAGGTPLMKESGANAASSVGIGTGGTNAINIDSSQRVGIGTANPSNGLLNLKHATSNTILDFECVAANDGTTGNIIQFRGKGVNGVLYNASQIRGATENGVNNFGSLSFWTNSNGTVGQRMRIGSDGNVKIIDQHLRFNTSGKGIIFGTEGGSNRPSIVGNYTSATNNNITFTNTGSERMRIDAFGNVGIGTTSPSGLIHAKNDSSSNTKVIVESTGTNSYPTLQIKNDARQYSLQIDGATDNLRVLDSAGTAQRITLTTSGNVGIGTTTPSEVLNVTGNILASGTITPNSDIVFKKDVEPLQNALSKITQLLGINFTYKDNNEKSMGLVAQDVEKVYPELIRGEEGNKSLNYMGLTGAIVEAIKELAVKVEALEKL